MISKSILTDAETLEMLNGFYTEALLFLGVPRDNWAEVKIGAVIGKDGKADVINIDYTKAKILVCLPVIKMMLQTNPVITNDAPSVYRSYGYKLARMWQQYLNDGLQRDFLTDKDSTDFAVALSLLKGINYADMTDVLDIDAAISMLHDEFGIDCEVVQALDQIHKKKRKVVTLTHDDKQKRSDELKKLYDENCTGSYESLFKHLGLLQFARGVMWVEQRALGMSDEYLICEPDEKIGKVIIKEIEEGGNFGHHDKRYTLRNKGYLARGIADGYRLIKLARYFPQDAVWKIVRRIENQKWKLLE